MLSLYTAAAGMSAQQFHIDTISHNLANINTTAFKRVRAEFQDLIYLPIHRPTAYDAVGLDVGLGVCPSASYTIFEQGSIQQTENPLDLSLSGPGFLVVIGPGGERFYTRDGSFKLDAAGNLVTSDGYRVELEDGRQFPGTENITVSQDGRISYLDAEGNEVFLGRLVIAQFDNPAGLEKVGRNLYRSSAASGEARISNAGVTVNQYSLEGSNVQVVEEMIRLITAQRTYELNSKAVQASDEMLSIINNLRR